MLEANDIKALNELFSASASAYWESHFMFDRESAKQNKALGQDGVNNILINTVVPFLFTYGQDKNESEFQGRALQLLEQLPFENNAITGKFSSAGIFCPDAYHSQALLQLKKEYCDGKQCLNCNIGNYLLKNS
jgi:hypothetical protein